MLSLTEACRYGVLVEYNSMADNSYEVPNGFGQWHSLEQEVN